MFAADSTVGSLHTARVDQHPPIPRDAQLRNQYLTAALPHIPRLLGAIDRNPLRPTYGCLDRQFWHYRTSDFPSEMYQEGVLPLALVHAHQMPGNRWFGEPRVRELAVAGIRFAADSCHRDGSCDDYYPFERALGAAVFSLNAAARAYRLLHLDDPSLRTWLARRSRWLVRHDETGRLSNHQALAALGLLRVAEILAADEFRVAAIARLERLLDWQSDEGWFDEYGGADPGYQTVTIDCLVQCRRLLSGPWLDEPIRRAVAFTRLFLHPDDSFGGEYGSRGTYHFYPHGFEQLAATDHAAADLADGFLRSLATGRQAYFDDDRMYAHRLGNLIEAYLDWSPHRPPGDATELTGGFLPNARLLVDRRGEQMTIISAARGGVFKHFASTTDTSPTRQRGNTATDSTQADQSPSVTTDAGLMVEMSDGRVAASQAHALDRDIIVEAGSDRPLRQLVVSGPLHWVTCETATPLKFAIFRLGLWAVGRWCRSLVRRLLQQRLITGRRRCPVRLSRTFEFLDESSVHAPCRLRVTDTIELTEPRAVVRRMSFGTDHQTAYVAAAGVYQQAVLEPWYDLSEHVERLNHERRVTIVRDL